MSYSNIISIPDAAASFQLSGTPPEESSKPRSVLQRVSALFSMLWPDHGLPPAWKRDFISVLACAQRFGVDFVGVTWQGPGRLGRGAQSAIFQADASLKDRFAFKTSSPTHRVSLNHEREIFHELLVQILILGHPALRDHPNILTLHAIGWELEKPAELETAVWPVLIFEKTELKSLDGFMKSEKLGGDLSLTEKVDICADIASALATMHAHSKFVVLP